MKVFCPQKSFLGITKLLFETVHCCYTFLQKFICLLQHNFDNSYHSDMFFPFSHFIALITMHLYSKSNLSHSYLPKIIVCNIMQISYVIFSISCMDKAQIQGLINTFSSLIYTGGPLATFEF